MIGKPARLTLAAECATLLGALTMAPLVRGGWWFAVVVLIVGVVGGVGYGLRRVVQAWPVVLLVQTLAVTLVITWLFARDTAIAGLLPGPRSVREIGDLYQAGMTTTRDALPPVDGSRGVLVMIALGIGLVALSVDLIAASLERPAVAGLPLLAVYCVPAAVLPGGLAWWYFAAAAAGFLVLVGVDAADRLRDWGPVLGPAGRDRGSPGDAALGVRGLAAGCVLLAALSPLLVPGLHSTLLGKRAGTEGAGGGTISVINPILQLRADLTARKNTVVIRYTTSDPHPPPLRIVSDDVFDGDSWAPARAQISTENRVQDGLPPAPGLLPEVAVQPLRSTITIFDLAENYLPLPYPATRVQIHGSWIYDPRSLNVVGDGVTTRDQHYVADSESVLPTTADLADAEQPPADVVADYGSLPGGLPTVIAATARRVVGSAGTAYARALALQDWLRSGGGFTYSLDVTPPKGRLDSSADAVAAFLADKRGYCVQFASAMAVMARTLGIPSRVAVGFLPGTRQKDGSWAITLRDAHAWPELYFSGVGWVRFEPTPASRTGQAPTWTAPQSSTPSPTAATPHRTVPATPSTTASASTTAGRSHTPTASARTHPSSITTVWHWAVLLLVLALLAMAPLGIARSVRGARWRRIARSPVAVRTEAAWDSLREQLEDLGVRWAASWTPRALRARLAQDHRLPSDALAALDRLVDDLERARYAPPSVRDLSGPSDPSDRHDRRDRPVTALRADVETVVRAVAASVPPSRRRRARWLPVVRRPRSAGPRPGDPRLARPLRDADPRSDAPTTARR